MRWYSKRSRPFSYPIHSKTPRLTYPEYFIHIQRSRIHSRSKVASLPLPSPNSDRHSSNSFVEISPYFNPEVRKYLYRCHINLPVIHLIETHSFFSSSSCWIHTYNLSNLISTKLTDIITKFKLGKTTKFQYLIISISNITLLYWR